VSKKSDTPMPVEVVPSTQGEVSAIASAHAPFFYFENATAFGHLNGIIRITLEATRDVLRGTSVVNDRVMVAHLRMNVPAALSLKAAIDGALLIAMPSDAEKMN
jgi:hypothetical protein